MMASLYEVRDLPYGKWKKAYLLFDKVRVEYPKCGVKIEKLEWVEPWSLSVKSSDNHLTN
ncbi:MAG: hypothetical protein AB1599_01920 [Planctomycetota bacterium]